MTTFKMRLISGLMLASIGMMAGSIATAGEIKQDMKEMKKNLRGAIKSDSVEELVPYIEALKYSAWHASNLNFDGSEQEKNTYREGLTKVHKQLEEVDQAIKNHDLDGAKRILSNVRDTQDTYHQKLNVE
jgi:soluble cytochrome b562